MLTKTKKTLVANALPRRNSFATSIPINRNETIKKPFPFDELIAIKRNKTQKYQEESPLFFMVGLIFALLSVIIVFNWKSYDNAQIMDLGTIENDFNEIIEIPPTEQLPPPPPQRIVAPVIKEVSDEEILEEIEADIDMEVTEDMTMSEVVDFDFTNAVEEETVEEIFTIVESLPEPEGGIKAFYTYVSENMNYPNAAKRLGISGKVFVQFVVEKDGSLTDIKIIKGIHEDCDAEAIRVISEAPKWIPGKQRGRPVRVYKTLPIIFILRE